MYVEDLRPLKRPKLGFPDYYPQDKNQKEDQLTVATLNSGLKYQPCFDDENGSALNEIQSLKAIDIPQRINTIVEAKRRSAWGQDSQKKKNNLSRDNFCPVPVGRSKKESAWNWFQLLAGTEPFDSLIRKKVPIFNKREEIFEILFEKNVPVYRSVWYIKMTASYNLLGADSKLTKKKQTFDPSIDWTVSLTKYMMECAWKICNVTTGSRHDSFLSTSNTTTDKAVELDRWKYFTELSSWLYQENLLDRQEFFRWLIDRIETSKPTDDRSLALYLPMALKYIQEISECVFLARPLVSFCCQKFAYLYEMQQKVNQFQLHHPTKKQSMKDSTRGVGTSTTNEFGNTGAAEGGDDDVFSGNTDTEVDSKRNNTDNTSQGGSAPSGGGVAGRKRSKSGSLTVNIEAISNMDTSNTTSTAEDSKEGVNKSHDSCKHHASLLLQLSCIIQLMAVQCPTAFIHISLTGSGKAPSRDITVPKPSTPLDKLPMKLNEMPLPKRGMDGIWKKVHSSLSAVDCEIRKRAKAAETGWLAISDLQTSNKGHIVERVLSFLELIDSHSFTTCKYHSPLSTLFVKTIQSLKVEPSFENYQPLCMLLCQWAITPYRHGNQRPIVAARFLGQLQSYVLQTKPPSFYHDLQALDDSWDQPLTSCYLNDPTAFPFQSTLIKFLDNRGPVPISLYHPLKSNEPFFLTLVLFSELINAGVFSYPLYLSTLIARGEVTDPIVPQLPFFRGENESPPPSPMETADSEEQLSLKVSLPIIPGLILCNRSTPKKACIVKQEVEDTLSPSLPDRFGSQDILMDPFDGINDSLMSHNNSTLIKTEDSSTILEEREKKLRNLAELAMPSDDPLGDEGGSTHLEEFDSQPSSPKADMFDFYQPFSPSLHENESLSSAMPRKKKKLNKHASRHLLYASYLPVSPSKLSKQERVVVLCGTGHTRIQVEGIVSGIAKKAVTIHHELEGDNSLILPSATVEFMNQFKMLPNYNQNEIALLCVDKVSENLSTKCVYPSCAQLVFVCELLEVSASIRKLVDTLVEIVSFASDRREDKHHPIRLPLVLCTPIVNLLWHYFPVLLLSISDVTLVYESLQRALEGSQKPSFKLHQRSVCLFLQHIHQNCLFIKRNYPSIPNSYVDYCVPAVVEMQWVNSMVSNFLNTNQHNLLFSTTRNTGECTEQIVSLLLPASRNSFYFVCEVLSTVIQKQTTLQMIAVLAQLCAEVGCTIDRVTNELLGGIRALCIPATVYKACSTGFTQLTQKANVITNTGIHGNLITFIGLLLSFNCFTILDVITYIVKPIFKVYLLYPQKSGTYAINGSISLSFVSLLLRHILVSECVSGDHSTRVENCGIMYPSFVRHHILTKQELLSFETLLNLLKELLKLCKDTLKSTKGTTISSKTGMSILVESLASGSERNEEALLKLRSTLELIACQGWIREHCYNQQGKSQLLELERFGDALSPQHAQYLLHLLIPYCTEDTCASVTAPDGSLPQYMVDPSLSLERILKKLDQWTLRNAFLHLEIIVNQQPPGSSQHNMMIDHLAQCVIQVFEDSCGNDWTGNLHSDVMTNEGDISDDTAAVDGAHSPSIWLVTPLVSKLSYILGRVLKSAGTVLGRGQWWCQEKAMPEKKRLSKSTNTSSSKTSLQWQQPFLELILASMNLSQSTHHEELLLPLQKQLHVFLQAFEKDGPPLDEQGKTMMYAALRLRLSLVGSMLITVCSSETSILDWISLLVQLICSGAVDRQPDNCELFTNCLDMLNALLQTLTHDFHMCMMSGGEDGKKNHISCIKKMKADLQASKSTCKQEIQQLFPLHHKSYEVTIVKPPAFPFSRSSDKVQGLRVQETKEISSWEIIEGTRHSGQLQLSWFGATRTKRKPLRYVEQRRIIRFHSHHHNMEHMTASPYFLYLPKQSQAIPSTIPQNPNLQDPSLNGANKNNPQGNMAGDDGQGMREKRTAILKTIAEMNKGGSKAHQTNVAPLPPVLQTPTGGINPQLRAKGPGAGPMMTASGGGPASTGPTAAGGMINTQPGSGGGNMIGGPHPHPIQPPTQPTYGANWYNALAQNLTPQQKSMIAAMSHEDRKMYLINMRRKFEQHRMMVANQAGGGAPQIHPGNTGGGGMQPPYRHLGGRQMAPPGMGPHMGQVIHTGQRPGMMPTGMYPHHSQMPPPGAGGPHPGQPGTGGAGGFMMPPGAGHPGHHPGQNVYQQSMYGSGPPQHNMMGGYPR